ncbi:MAG: hypothetical protein QM654_00540 [Dysgonamonadaceae bacterium]
MLNIITYLFLFYSNERVSSNKRQSVFSKADSEIENMLLQHNDTSLCFKKAIFYVKNAFFENQIKENVFNDIIDFYSDFCKDIMKSGNIVCDEKDKDVAMGQCATFLFTTDSISILINNEKVRSTPFSYNHKDPFGKQDWSNMFVSTLMQTLKSGVSNGNSTQAGSVYNDAHKAATPQNTVYQTMYDANGKITTDVSKAVKVDWYVKTIQDKDKVIQTLP